MKLYVEALKLLFKKLILRRNTGEVVKEFAEKMGIVYIKLAQILSTQNYGNLFTEKDRELLSSICDDIKPISFEEIEMTLKEEYGNNYSNMFQYIEKEPIGSASVSQVHKAVLKTGEEVVLKVKRKDIGETIKSDIERIRGIIHRFGRIVKLGNYTGGDFALDLYMKWIKEETDFRHEVENIKAYKNFADTVNNKVEGTKSIKIPKIYEEFCTDNVIVMEYINAPTINKMELTEENKEKIRSAMNSYIKSSFWALFNDKQIVFHGDPHSGNICVDEEENIYFLDMGLLCIMSDSDAKLCRKLFLAAYTGNYENMFNLVSSFGNLCEEDKKKLREDCKHYSLNIKGKELTYYFVDMINICYKYEIVPPAFLFSMVKTFMCLNGIGKFCDNEVLGKDLLREQVTEFMIKRSLEDCKGIVVDSIKLAPRIFEDTMKYGLVRTISKVSANSDLRTDIIRSLENLKEMIEMMKVAQSSEPYIGVEPQEENGRTM